MDFAFYEIEMREGEKERKVRISYVHRGGKVSAPQTINVILYTTGTGISTQLSTSDMRGVLGANKQPGL
ncbi:hypothetical protein J6590_094469 [Homalodisca vitripennis]|nr:hypothetical protein J6590_094469 [Homalodisca vitripennis]